MIVALMAIAFVAAAPQPKPAPHVALAYTAGSPVYASAPLTSAYSAYSSPYAYSAYSAYPQYSAYSAYPYSAYSTFY